MTPSPDVPKLIRALLDSTSLLVVVVSSDFTVLDWNATAEGTLGYPSSEAFGRDLGDLVGPGPAAGKLRTMVSEVLASGRAEWTDADQRTPHGARRLVGWVVVPLEDDRGPAGAILIGTDLSARQPSVP